MVNAALSAMHHDSTTFSELVSFLTRAPGSASPYPVKTTNGMPRSSAASTTVKPDFLEPSDQ
jgi:hypothetical protein